MNVTHELDRSHRRQRRRWAVTVAACVGLLALLGAAIAVAKWERIETYRVGSEPTSVAVGELTGDKINDVVVGNALSSYVSLFKSRPDGLYNLPVKVRMGRSQSAVGVGRFDKGKRRDIVAASDLGQRLIVRYGKKRGFQKPRSEKTGGAPSALAVGRLDGGGRDDVVVANSASDSISVFKGSKKGLKRGRRFKVGGNVPVAVAIGDVGGSNRRDVVTANARTKNISILIAKKGGFRKPVLVPIGPEPADVAIGQLGRGKGNDIAVVAAGSSKFTVLFGRKRGLQVRTFNGLKNADGVDIGRIDRDGRAEIAFSSSLKNKVAVYKRRKGGFRKGLTLAIPGGPTAIKIAHLDFDPNRDLATANVDGFTGSIIHQF